MTRLVILFLWLIGSAGLAADAQDDMATPPGLLADLSQDLIEIRYSFDGADLLLFGAINLPPSDGQRDLVVVVKGPPSPTVVRRKERVAGIWVNTQSLTYVDAPGYYAVTSTRPLNEIADDVALRRLEIGFDKVRLFFDTNMANEDQVLFRRALIRNQQRAGLYRDSVGAISVVDGALFRTDLRLPANVPIGDYEAAIYLFEGGQLVSQRAQPLLVDKSGFERAVYTFAHDQPLLYGIVAVLIALAAGWIAGTVARK